MILLVLDCLLLIFISLGIGYRGLPLISRIFNSNISSGLFGIFLSGLIFSTIYFNLISFWLPVNYFSLIPLLLLSLWSAKRHRWHLSLLKNAKTNFALFFTKKHLPFFLLLLALVSIYVIIPPINYDSGDYHYLSMLWYEKYKVVPGLANVHGRLAFNPVSFIIGAAYSFTELTGQSIYPLNVVLVPMFLFWLLKKLLLSNQSLSFIIYFILIVLYFRPLLANTSSPSSEPLVIICIAYGVLSLFHAYQQNRFSLENTFIPAIVLVYSVTAKLNAIPALLFLPYFFYSLPKTERHLKIFTRLSIVAAFILLPWLARNLILSGYLLYPSPLLNIFQFDWKAPLDVLKLDYVSFTGWFSLLHFKEFNFDFLIFAAAIISPFYWLLQKIKTINKNVFLLWLIAYLDVWVWTMNTPDYRFGIAYLSLAIALPLLHVLSKYKTTIILCNAVFVGFIITTAYYFQQAFVKCSYSFTIKDIWLYPLKDSRYYYNNDLKTFKYKQLNNGVKLYISDQLHECINAPMPCMSWYYGEIEMRGKRLDEGFRNTSDEVRKHFPVLNKYYKD